MKTNKNIVLFITYFLSLQFVFAECNQKLVLKDLKQAKESLNGQTQNIEKYLAGGKGEDFSPITVFGPDFKLSDTSDIIKSLKDESKSGLAISIGFQGLYQCLKKLGLVNEVKALEEESLKLNTVKIALLEKNLELEDSLRVGKVTKGELPRLKDEINQENKTTEEIKSKLENSLLKNITKVSKEENSQRKEILNYESELTKIEILLLNLRLDLKKIFKRKSHTLKV